MRKSVSVVLAAVLAVSGMAIPASANASMPTIWSASQAENTALENVRHRRGHYRGHHHRRYYGHRHRHGGAGAAAAAGIIGLGIGAAIAAGAAERNDRAYAADRDWDAYCFSKYKSYDPRTGTYLGYDGRRHPCR